MTDEDFKEEIYDKLLWENPMSFSGLYRKIGGNRNRLKKAIDELISDRLLKQKSQGPGKEVQISLAPSDLLNHLNGLNKELSLIQTMIKRTFNALKAHKYLFKFPVQVGIPLRSFTKNRRQI